MRKRNKTPGLYRRGKQGIFYIQKQITVSGQSISLSESTGTASAEEAERYLNHRLAEIREQHLYGKARRMLLCEAADRMLEESQHLKTVDRYEASFKALIPALGHLHLDEIHDGKVAPYVQQRQAEGLSAASINRDIACLVRCLTLACRKWRDEAGNPYLTAVPMLSRAKGEARRPYPLNRKELEMLLRELPDHLKAVTEFGYHTGCRASEILGLRWDNEVEVPELGVFCFVLPCTKNGEERVVVLNSEARRIVDEQRVNNSEFVFTFKGRPITRVTNTAWQRARDEIGLPIRFHDIRHSTGHALRAVGCPEQDVAAILGHTTGSISTHYSAPELGKLLEWCEKLVEARPSTTLRTGWGKVIPLRKADKASERIAVLGQTYVKTESYGAEERT